MKTYAIGMTAAAAASALLGSADACASTRESALVDWEFCRGAETNRAWQAVRVPHDWAIAGPFDKEHDKQVVAIFENGEKVPMEKTGRSGALPWIGEGWYRREVEIPEGCGFASLVFDGAMSEARVFFDGAEIAFNPYGYSSFEVELPAAKSGKHALVVHLQNVPESSRWYPGAGLYRPVRLVTGGAVGVRTWGVNVRTPTLQTWEADVDVRNLGKVQVAVRQKISRK